MKEKDKFEEAVEKVKSMPEGEKKRLMMKAVTHYIESMIGEENG